MVTAWAACPGRAGRATLTTARRARSVRDNTRMRTERIQRRRPAIRQTPAAEVRTACASGQALTLDADRHLPLGAPARRASRLARPHGVPRLGAARASASRSSSRGASTRSSDAGYGVFEAERRRRPPATRYRFVVDGTPLPDPVQPLAARGPARALGGRRPRRVRVDRRAVAAAVAARPRALRAARRHVHARRARSRRRSSTSRALRELGVTAIELMPVAEFPGRHGWGYDGVYLCAAHSAYGGPDGLARLVDAAHAAGLAVILDVVYNHLGAPACRRSTAFGPYFTDAHETPWGEALNLDREDSDAVRELVLESAEGWIRDFHVDGLRLDAIHAIVDSSPEHLVAEIARRVHAANAARARDRRVRPQRPARRARAGARRLGLRRRLGRRLPPRAARAAHRRARRLLRGVRRARRPGQGAAPPARPRRQLLERSAGAASARPPTTSPPERFVVFSADHDQVGNRAFGDRLPVEVRPLAALLHAPGTLHADAVPGRGVRRAGAVPVLLRSHRRRDRRRDARGAPARVRRVRRVRRRGGARSAGPGDVRALQAHARRASRRGCAS